MTKTTSVPAKADAPPGKVSIIEQRGSHLLIERGKFFAVIERRDGEYYRLDCGAREGFPDSETGMAQAADGSWADEVTVRSLFAEISGRGNDLAEHLR